MNTIAAPSLVLEPVLAASLLRTGAFVLAGVLVVLGGIVFYQWLQLRR